VLQRPQPVFDLAYSFKHSLSIRSTGHVRRPEPAYAQSELSRYLLRCTARDPCAESEKPPSYSQRSRTSRGRVGVQDSRISEGTQLRVRDAARELGYVPNVNARSLRVGRTNLVIAHLPGGTPMLQRAAAGLERFGTSLRELGYTLLVHGDTSLQGVDAARQWSALRPAALITELSRLNPASLAMLRSVGTVVVAIAQTESKDVPTLAFDDSMLGEVAVAHLIERGCKDIALIQPKHPRARIRARQRSLGAQRALRRAKGVRLAMVSMGSGRAEAERVTELWAHGPRPEGVFGFDDEYAGMLLGALLDRGVRVPEQLALVGADDSPLCEMLRPRLTSVAIDLESLHRSIAEPVLKAIQGTWTHGRSDMPWDATLHVRDT
jgi:DNA-binding LacI/PurR family transcriptional regulator